MNGKTIWLRHPAEIPTGEKDAYGAPSPWFRAQFALQEKPVRAILRAAALGIFKIRMNGREIDSDRFAPGWVDYRRRVPYEEYDVTAFIGRKNCVAAALGDGWYAGMLGLYFKRNRYGSTRCLWLELEMEFADGSRRTVGTDADWKCAFCEIRGNDFFNGEIWDARLKAPGFDRWGFDDSGWEPAERCVPECGPLESARAERIRICETLPALSRSKRGNTEVFDFGQNMVGFLRLEARGERGARVTIRHGEMLNPDGSVYTDNLRTAAATDTFILAGEGKEVFEPLFTFHGFRYAEIETEGRAEVLRAEGRVVHSDLSRTGDFSCSDPVVEKIWKNTLWGQRGNFIGVPTDCPQRDERLGWTGDAQIFCGSAMYNMDCRRFFEKYLVDVRDACYEDGAVPIIAPYTSDERHIPTAGWGDVITILPYTHYRMYGDKGVLADNVEFMKRWLAYCEKLSEGLIRYGPTYGDWLNVEDETDARVFETAYFAHSADLTARSLDALGRKEEAAHYRTLFDEIRAAFRKEFLSDGGVIRGDTQTSYLLAYAFGLENAEESRPNLLRKLKERDYHLSSGFCGIKYLLPVLCDLGESALAYRLITETTYPSWGYSVINGATTIWERWNSYTCENGFGDDKMNSFNHYSLGSCVEWLYSYALGIRPAEPGFARVLLAPRFDFSGRIHWAKGSYVTPRGRVSVNWRKTDAGVEYWAELPPDLSFDVDFCGRSSKKENVGDGKWRFLID